MPDSRDLPLHRWGEELRRRRRARRRRRLRGTATACAVMAVTALCTVAIRPPRPALAWNRSPSSPIGLYRVSSPEGVGAGDMVLAWPPAGARRLSAERHYLPSGMPLVKRVAAARGDRVCAAGQALFVNGRLLVTRRRADRTGRRLPWWSGCRLLRQEELLLLGSGAPDSFDGRYFGVTERKQVIGRSRLTWAR